MTITLHGFFYEFELHIHKLLEIRPAIKIGIRLLQTDNACNASPISIDCSQIQRSFIEEKRLPKKGGLK